MNEIVFISIDKFMSEIHLRQLVFTCSAVDHSLKIKKE